MIIVSFASPMHGLRMAEITHCTAPCRSGPWQWLTPTNLRHTSIRLTLHLPTHNAHDVAHNLHKSAATAKCCTAHRFATWARCLPLRVQPQDASRQCTHPRATPPNHPSRDCDRCAAHFASRDTAIFLAVKLYSILPTALPDAFPATAVLYSLHNSPSFSARLDTLQRLFLQQPLFSPHVYQITQILHLNKWRHALGIFQCCSRWWVKPRSAVRGG